MSETPAIVYVVDDDAAVRDSLRLLLKSVGLLCETFESATEFLDSLDGNGRACLVADIRMPGMSGLELQAELNKRQVHLPLIFITGHGDVPMAVDAMKAGALDFLQKPFRDQDLLDRINQALTEDQQWHEADEERGVIEERIATLTPREKQVMECVVRGDANKVIAFDLDVSQRTVEIHRARVMEKMGVRTLAELVRMASKAGM
jgi:two-component system response regulator FixJ